MVNFGYIPSVMDGTEYIFEKDKSRDYPEEYSYIKYLSPILNQGQYPICAPCSISAYLNWKENIKTGETIDNGIRVFDIYNSKTTDGDGMTFKDAFKYLRHHGVKSNAGELRIGGYARVNNLNDIKAAIFTNGPCVGALPVFGEIFPDTFWLRSNGIQQGGHAISLVGYTQDGLIMRNSWGTGYGTNGYILIPNSDIGYLMEVWTIFG